MKTICAWCGKHISGDKDDPDISHGICKDCDKKKREELKRRKKGWREKMKPEGYTKLLFMGLIIVVIILFCIFVIDPITDFFEQIIKRFEELGH